ncbi:MAG TPA: glycosyltransferase family 87 protein [Fimbriiglobus sp.]
MPEPAAPSFRSTFRLDPSRYLRPAVAAVCVVALAIVVAKYLDKVAKPSRLGDTTRTAFLRWRGQVHDLFTGVDVYRAYQYPNPPVMAIVLRPFMALPPVTGAVVWLLVKAGLTVLTVFWGIRIVRGDGPPIPDPAVAIAFFLALHPILGDLAHGNVNLFIGFLVFAALELFRRRADATAGLVLALAVACKVTPALFLPYFVWKRAWRALAGVAIGLLLWLVVVPGAMLGWGHNFDLLHSWYDEMVRPFAVEGKVTSEHANQSIPGVTVRLLTSEPSFLTYGDDGSGPAEAAAFHNFTDIGPTNANRLVKGCMVLFGLVVVWLCRWPTHKPNITRAGPAFAAECSLILLGMLLFSERTWKHHATTLFLPMLVLTASVWSADTPRNWKRAFVGVLAAAAALMVVPGLVGGDFQNLSMVYGSYGLAFQLLAAGVVGVLISRRSA